MKKFLFSIFALSLVAFGYWQSHKDQKFYQKNESYLKHLKKDHFALKLSRPLPKWMEDQIEENFQDFKGGFNKACVDATFQQIQSTFPSPYLVRYRLVGGELYRYFRDGELISLEDNSTERAIKTLTQIATLPDLDCIISYFDGTRPNYTFFHTYSKAQQAPLLISAKIQETPYIVLIPDWRSLGDWWASDIKHVKTTMKEFPWEKKREFALWRGGYNRKERKTLCQLSLEFPEYLDAKFNLPLDNPEVAGMTGENVSWEEFLSCKYLPYVDGYMTASPALQWRLLSNSVLFKPETNEVQWFHRALKPFVHYIPVKTDLSDLIEMIDWAKEHDAECKAISENATQFALDSLMMDDVFLYFYATLNRYGSLQKINSKSLKQETLSDPHWVKIQYRSFLKKRAAKAQMRGYCKEATPGGGMINFSDTATIPSIDFGCN